MTRESDLFVTEALQLSRALLRSVERLNELGELEVGSCKRHVVMESDSLTLYHYEPRRRERLAPPVLIVYALVNRSYMLDLDQDHSLVRRLLDQGVDIYLIDWKAPERHHRDASLANYVIDFIGGAVDAVCGDTGLPAISLLGVCQGGTLACCYAALFPEKVTRLIVSVTPIDFHTAEDQLSRLVRHVDLDVLVDVYGNVPGEILNGVFLSLKPFQLGIKKYLDLGRYAGNDKRLAVFSRMERWIFDSPPQSGRAFRDFVGEMYQRNSLLKGELVLDGNKVILAELDMPVLNIYASSDHLVPPAASRALGDIVGTDDYEEFDFSGGHIGLYVSRSAQRVVPRKVADWLLERPG